MSLVDEARTVRQRIANRLAELEPLAREYEELKQLAAEMGVERTPTATSGSVAGRTSAASPRNASGSATRSMSASGSGSASGSESGSGSASGSGSESASAPASRRSARPRRAPASRSKRSSASAGTPSTELANRVIEAVRADPGKTVAEYATALQVTPTALYRPVRQLTTSGDVVKRARQLFPG